MTAEKIKKTRTTTDTASKSLVMASYKTYIENCTLSNSPVNTAKFVRDYSQRSLVKLKYNTFRGWLKRAEEINVCVPQLKSDRSASLTQKIRKYLLQSNKLKYAPNNEGRGHHSTSQVIHVGKLMQAHLLLQEPPSMYHPILVSTQLVAEINRRAPLLCKGLPPPSHEEAQRITEELTRLGSNVVNGVPLSLEVRYDQSRGMYALYTLCAIKKGSCVGYYEGQNHSMSAIKRDIANIDMEYMYTTSKLGINAIHIHSCFLRYANDSFDKPVNSKYQCVVCHPVTQLSCVSIVSTESIAAGEEITVSYGENYWRDYIFADSADATLREQILSKYPNLSVSL